MKQADLFDEPRGIPLNENHRRYLVWRGESRDVWILIRDLALNMLARKRRFSIDMCVAYVRFNAYFLGYRDTPYRISDHHVAYLAREFIQLYPEMKEYIQIKRVQGEREAQDEMERGEESW